MNTWRILILDKASDEIEVHESGHERAIGATLPKISEIKHLGLQR